MADDKALKPKSFRIDDATANKFKEISSAIGGNQQETLSKLIEAYEFQSGKAILTEKKADIEQFERYVTAITRMFMGSLEDNQAITETVRTEYDALLKSKDATIQDLQEKLTVAKQLKEEATARAKAHADENNRLNSAIDSLNTEYNSKIEDMQAMLSDKDNLNKALTDSCNDLKAKVESMKEESAQLEQLKLDYDKVVKEKSDLENQMNQEQIAHDKELLKIEKKHQEQLEKLKAAKQAEVDKYQQKYLELLEQLKNNNVAAGVEEN